MHLPPIKKLYEQTTANFFHGPGFGTSDFTYIEDMVQKYIEKINEKGIPFKLGSQKLGVGTGNRKGIPYDLGSTVLKATQDKTEANACNRIKGKKLKNVYEVYDVYELNNAGVYIIHQEKLQPMEQKLKDHWHYIYNTLDYIGTSWVTDLKDLVNAMKKEWNYNYPRRLIPATFIKVLKDVYNGLEELKANGIEYDDYHRNNIMKRGKDYVIIDLGVSRSGEVPIEKL